MIISREDKEGFVEIGQVRAAVAEFFARNDYAGKRILLIIPDNTRSGPVGDVFKIIYEQLRQKAKAVDCLVAKEANCFPMIPSGAAHPDMMLYGDSVAGTMDDEAKALV